MELFDTHAHLNDEQFAPILDDVIQRARSQFVKGIVVVGTNREDSQRAIEIANRYRDVWASVGIQPNQVADAQPDDMATIKALADDPSVVAIGETGLDRYWDFSPFDQQREYFARHIELSLETGKPFIVHMRECEQDILDSLKAFSSSAPLNGVMHSFTGDLPMAEKCLEFGLHISFAGMVTYKKSDALRKVAASIPMDRLLLETDSPYLSPHPKRGQRPNEPALIVHTAEFIAVEKSIALESIARITTQNARQLFSIP